MASLIDYKGLQVVNPEPSGAGGLAIQDDLKSLVDWNPKSVWDKTAAPTAADDVDDDFYPGSRWFNTTSGALFVCVDNTVEAAVWTQVSGGSGSPGGSNMQVQFNNGGAFGGDVNFTWNESTNVLAVNGQVNVDNLRLDENTLSSTNSNGDIFLSPDGSGRISLSGLDWPAADGGSGEVLLTNGSGDLAFGQIVAESITDGAVTLAKLSGLTTKGDLLTYNGSANARLPVGSDSQVLTADSTQSLGVKWATPTTGQSMSYALVVDEKATGTNGGASESGFQTRALNTERFDPDGIVSLPGSNVFRLNAGKYVIRVAVPASGVGEHIARLFNVTGSTVVTAGTSEYCLSDESTASKISAYLDISTQTDFRIEHNTGARSATNTLGHAADKTSALETYTVVEIQKIG